MSENGGVLSPFPPEPHARYNRNVPTILKLQPHTIVARF
jgi:hypothetical protein